MRHNSNDSNSSNDLIIPEYLLKKFPFIQTLIVYSNLIMKSKYDFTFLNIILNNMFRNLSTEERGFRYEDAVRQFATSLYILGGRTAYEFIRVNIPAFLPTVRIIQSFIAASDNHLTEGLFNYEKASDYFNSIQSTIGFIAEDTTAVVSKVTYDTTSNKFIGFALPLDNNGFPIANSYSTESFSCLEEWYSSVPRAKSLNAYLIQPLSSSANNTSPYLLSAYGTDNKYESSDVISRWHHIHQKFKAKGIRILGFSTDCDSRYLHAMRASLDEMSNIASSALDAFWSSVIDTINSQDIESENETNSAEENNSTNDCDSDEEFELNDNLVMVNDADISTYRGIRLIDDVKKELSHTFFKVNINKENKFLHKQAACWFLEKDKSSLSANRLSRVAGR
ncbi:unnamed protein product [Rotaria sp. Silwood2]|nr:unnamed protein product [Rotaria sp. Silwood2]CAF4287931.1 unnamed protein product [Rotaria sp. Silwood2]